MKKTNLLFSLLLVFYFFSCKKNTTNIHLEKGMVISESVTVAKDTFYIDGSKDQKNPVITIKGNDLSIDFQGAVLQGSNGTFYPDEIYGLGIIIHGNNIEIKNLKVHGYRIGILSTGVDGIKILDSEFSYNYRCNSFLGEDIEENNDEARIKDRNPSAGIVFDNCKNILFKNNVVQQNQIGIITSNCKNGKIYNNQITYNSHTGIHTSGSSDLLIMHNFLDFNREFGIRCSFQSQDNIIAYNSITHVPFNDPEKNIGFQNNHFPFEAVETPDSLSKKYPPLPDGQNTDEFPSPFKGENYFLFNEWGLYNFEYPAIWFREVNEDKYTFAIFGPEGNWKIIDGYGFVQTSRQSGSMPATIVGTKQKDVNQYELSLKLEFIGVEFTDQFGNVNPRGKTFKFDFQNRDGTANNEQ